MKGDRAVGYLEQRRSSRLIFISMQPNTALLAIDSRSNTAKNVLQDAFICCSFSTPTTAQTKWATLTPNKAGVTVHSDQVGNYLGKIRRAIVACFLQLMYVAFWLRFNNLNAQLGFFK